jgi:hypothetical protein
VDLSHLHVSLVRVADERVQCFCFSQRNGRGSDRSRVVEVPIADQAVLSGTVALSTISPPTYAMAFIQRGYDCGVHYVQSLGVLTTQWDSMAAFSIFNGFRTTWYPSHPFYPPMVLYTGMIVAFEQLTFSNGIHSGSRLISPDHHLLIS